MESRKRKEAGGDASELSDRPTKTAKEDETKAEDSPANMETGTEEADPAAAAAAAATNAIDAAALPNGSAPVANDTPAAAPTEGTSELDAAAVTPKVPSKPTTPEELAHWNQMFFDLMVRPSIVRFSWPLLNTVSCFFVMPYLAYHE